MKQNDENGREQGTYTTAVAHTRSAVVNRDAEKPVEGAMKDRSNKIGTEVVMKRSRGKEYQTTKNQNKESKQRVRKSARKKECGSGTVARIVTQTAFGVSATSPWRF